jgi:NAD(P)-dependent dehydrogenase (short-subunit alcohol dehydrogenase family)
VTEADWRQVMDLDLTGVFFGSCEAARRMKEAGKGVIVNISSLAGLRGAANASAYVAAKHGVEGLTKALAAELGPAGVRVLAIAPTFIRTPGTTTMSGAPVDDQQVGRIPLGRVGVPDDIARAVLFCASDLSLFMTGSTLYLDGGQLALV